MYQTIAYCTDDDCRCLDRSGVILYGGDDSDAAQRAADDLTPRGYDVEIVTDQERAFIL